MKTLKGVVLAIILACIINKVLPVPVKNSTESQNESGTSEVLESVSKSTINCVQVTDIWLGNGK